MKELSTIVQCLLQMQIYNYFFNLRLKNSPFSSMRLAFDVILSIIELYSVGSPM